MSDKSKHNDAIDPLLGAYIQMVSSALQIPRYLFDSVTTVNSADISSDDDDDDIIGSLASKIAKEIDREILSKLPSEITPDTELSLEQLEIYMKVMAGKEDKEEIRFYHELFNNNEYLSFNPNDGFIYDENGNLFENWDLSDDTHNGIRQHKDNELFQFGWYIYD